MPRLLAVTLIALLTLPALGAVRAAKAQSPQAGKLAGLPENIHVVVTVDSAARSAGISDDTIRQHLETGLHQAGFNLTRVYGGSYLMVEVHAFQVSTTAMLVYDVGLEYHTFVVPARRLSALLSAHLSDRLIPAAELEPAVVGSVDVALYRRAIYGVGPRGEAAAVSQVAMRSLEMFVRDFRSVNPPGRQ